VEGGEEALITLVISGLGQKSGQRLDFRIPIWFYEADIQEDIILSYEWCRLQEVDISARQHGLLCFKAGQEIWIDGAQAPDLTHPEALVRAVEDNRGLAQNKKVDLDLFSGTGSVAKVLEGWGYEFITVDSETKWNSKVCVDRMDSLKLSPGVFDFIGASPSCTEFSVAKTIGQRNFDVAISFAKKN